MTEPVGAIVPLRLLGVSAAALVLLLPGCGQHANTAGGPGAGSGSGGDSNSGSSASSTALGGTIIVLAAASLTDAFGQLGKDFQSAHPGITVTFSFGSSATLATQVTQGAPADVFAAASSTTMETVTAAGDNSDTPQTFVTNTLEIAVPKGNPGKITGLSDFADADKKIVLCAASVPCGAAAVKVFALAGITPKPDSYETDVSAALQKVSDDEVDGALVYRTDIARADGSVQGIDFPESPKVVNSYPICTLKTSQNAAAATAFEQYVLSSAGQAVLSKAGFGQP